jgi:hypothetical protein
MKKNYKLFTTGLIAIAISSANAQCPIPSLVTASPSTICSGATTSLNATATGASINWFTAPIGGVAVGTSASAANFAISPSVTTTYYAESIGASSTATNTFAYTGGAQTFTVPAGVTSVTISASGAQGGNTAYTGGLGGNATGSFTVTPGQVLNLYVGGQGAVATTGGFNGGGNGGTGSAGNFGSGGGGASDVRVGGTALINRILVAGGGGGSGNLYSGFGGAGGAGSSCLSPFGVGGGFGTGCSSGNVGSCAGGTSPSYGTGGGGGGLNSGGAISGDGSGGAGGAGTLGVGGVGGTQVNGPGGGGGGYYGGAGGQSGSGGCNGGGGGGSSYSSSSLTVFTGSVQSGNGVIVIIYPNTCTSPSRTAVMVTVNSTPTISATSGAICAGKSYTIVASGASTYTYASGSAVVTPTANTSYSVTGTSSLGCVGSNTAISSVTVNANPIVSASTSNTLICSGESVALTASTTATSYTWNTGATTMSVSVSPTVTSTYTVNVSNAAACVSSSTVMVTVNACVGINEAVASLISVYPNPNNGILNINLTAELAKNASLEIYDALGKLVAKQTLANESNTLNISALTNGVYTFKVLNNSNLVKIGKLIKQ